MVTIDKERAKRGSEEPLRRSIHKKIDKILQHQLGVSTPGEVSEQLAFGTHIFDHGHMRNIPTLILSAPNTVFDPSIDLTISEQPLPTKTSSWKERLAYRRYRENQAKIATVEAIKHGIGKMYAFDNQTAEQISHSLGNGFNYMVRRPSTGKRGIVYAEARKQEREQIIAGFREVSKTTKKTNMVDQWVRAIDEYTAGLYQHEGYQLGAFREHWPQGHEPSHDQRRAQIQTTKSTVALPDTRVSVQSGMKSTWVFQEDKDDGLTVVEQDSHGRLGLQIRKSDGGSLKVTVTDMSAIAGLYVKSQGKEPISLQAEMGKVIAQARGMIADQPAVEQALYEYQVTVHTDPMGAIQKLLQVVPFEADLFNFTLAPGDMLVAVSDNYQAHTPTYSTATMDKIMNNFLQLDLSFWDTQLVLQRALYDNHKVHSEDIQDAHDAFIVIKA